MALHGPDARERSRGDLSVGLTRCHQVGDPLLDGGELVFQPSSAADAVEFRARLPFLNWCSELQEHGAGGLQLPAGVSPMTCPPEHLAKQQARPGFLERHRQSLMIDESAL